jgi:hypothetical protein
MFGARAEFSGIQRCQIISTAAKVSAAAQNPQV